LRRNINSKLPETIIDMERNFVFEEGSYIDNLSILLDIVLDLSQEYLKNDVNLVDLISSLFAIYTSISLDIEKDGDLISEMSPGKRGLILLELFLSISDEKHPILLDQPEDNLDNRTISRELVNFIRSKSRERQIILITHNANLVIL